MPWPTIPNLNTFANWGANRGQDVANWWDKLGVTQPPRQEYGSYNTGAPPTGGSYLASLMDWFKSTPPGPSRSTPYLEPQQEWDEPEPEMTEDQIMRLKTWPRATGVPMYRARNPWQGE